MFQCIERVRKGEKKQKEGGGEEEEGGARRRTRTRSRTRTRRRRRRRTTTTATATATTTTTTTTRRRTFKGKKEEQEQRNLRSVPRSRKTQVVVDAALQLYISVLCPVNCHAPMSIHLSHRGLQSITLPWESQSTAVRHSTEGSQILQSSTPLTEPPNTTVYHSSDRATKHYSLSLFLQSHQTL